MAKPLDWIEDELDRLREDGLVRERRVVTPLGRGECRLAGVDKQLIDFSSNDYLDLATDARLITAASDASSKSLSGARASALVSGVHPWHEELRKKLAAFEGTESALLFPTGYAANLGTVAALVATGDTVFCDRFNHASLVDGCRLSGARMRIFRHDDLEILERELANASGARRRLIVTDGLFSMDGDLAPLPELWKLAQQYDAMLLVDEAHATGTLGATGRGSIEHFQLHDQPIVRVGTLSKALGSLGGFVAGPQVVIDYLWNTARTQIYSTALPPSVCAAAATALRLVDSLADERRHLQQLGEQLRSELSRAGLDCPSGCCGPIVPILLGEPDRAVNASGALLQQGFLVPAIRPPTVPAGTSRLRVSLSAAHSDGDIRQFVNALSGVLEAV